MAFPSVLLLEGQDDYHVVSNLLDAHDLQDRFSLRPKDGIEQLLGSLAVELKGSDLQHLGLVVDANEAPAARWQKVTDTLRQCGFPNLPPQPDPEGTVVQMEGKPTVGVWLMPDNRVSGTIEDFAAILVPRCDPLWPRAQTCLDSIPGTDRRFAPMHHSKALIHTWLAWQEEPGVRMGAAITRKYLDPRASQAVLFIAWLRRLTASAAAPGP